MNTAIISELQRRLNGEPPVITKAGVSAILKATPEGLATALISTYGIVDSQNDRLSNGVFRSATTGDPTRFRILDQHSNASALKTIATPGRLYEVTRADLPASIRAQYPDATGGLIAADMRFMLDDPTSAAIYKRLVARSLREWSVGFQIDEGGSRFVTETINNRRASIREVFSATLYEWSAVTFGAGITDTLQTKTRRADPVMALKARLVRPDTTAITELRLADRAYRAALGRFNNGDASRREVNDLRRRRAVWSRLFIAEIDERMNR